MSSDELHALKVGTIIKSARLSAMVTHLPSAVFTEWRLMEADSKGRVFGSVWSVGEYTLERNYEISS